MPHRAAVAHLPEQEKGDPEAPGPFAFAEPDRVARILGLAGFSEIQVEAFDTARTRPGPREVEAARRFIV